MRQLLWREIRRRHVGALKPVGGKLTATALTMGPDRFAMGLTADDADRFQGFHSPNLMVVVDEAEGRVRGHL